ncbi:MAG: hypothetical protein AAFQ22_06090 [Pseudomonadota bacterium]
MYDARSSTGDKSDMIFGVATLVVVGVAFAAAWFGTGLFKSDAPSGAALPVAATMSGDSPLAQAFSEPNEQRLLRAYSQLDPKGYAQLETRIGATNSREKQIEALGEAVGLSILNNAEHLARVSASDINGMLDTATQALNAARSSNNQLCLGSTYTHLEGMSPARAQREAERLLEKAGFNVESAHAMAVSFQADFLEMAVRAKSNPQRHGKLTPQDEAAFQNLMMSFMTDPAFLSVAMADSQEAAMANLNLCEMGVKVLREVRQLPDGTKARAWASVFDMPEVRQGLREAKNFAF